MIARRLPPIKVEFSHDEYLRSHGKQPGGRGSWCFEFQHEAAYTAGFRDALAMNWTRGTSRATLIENGTKVQLWVSQATLTEAKAVIRAVIRATLPRGGWLSISVAP